MIPTVGFSININIYFPQICSKILPRPHSAPSRHNGLFTNKVCVSADIRKTGRLDVRISCKINRRIQNKDRYVICNCVGIIINMLSDLRNRFLKCNSIICYRNVSISDKNFYARSCFSICTMSSCYYIFVSYKCSSTTLSLQ